MIQLKKISEQHQAYANFCRLTSVRPFLRPKEYACLIWAFVGSIVTWILISFVLWRSAFLPNLFVVAYPYGPQGARFMSSTYLGLLLTIPFFFLYLYVSSRQIRTYLAARGILVDGWHWRGAAVERAMLELFEKYLNERGLLDDDVLQQLIESTRDEIAAQFKPGPGYWAVLAILFGVLIAIVQPIYSQLIQLWITTKSDIWQLTLMISGICLSTGSLTVAILPMGFVGSRARLEIYNHSLCAIRINVLKRLGSSRQCNVQKVEAENAQASVASQKPRRGKRLRRVARRFI